jgi:c-di-GMP-binding flagellar brake protein YcgR
MAAEEDLAKYEKRQRERRAYPRHQVDCPATITVLTGAGQISGRLVDLSLGGCRLATAERALVGIMVRVEVQFQLRGIAFRVIGVAAGTRTGKSFAIRFLDMPKRRYDELVGLIAEVEAANADRALVNAPEKTSTIVLNTNGAAGPESDSAPALDSAASSNANLRSLAGTAPFSSPGPSSKASSSHDSVSSARSNQASATGLAAAVKGDRRSHSRHAVDTRAKLLLVKGGISMPGRILNLSQGGCRLRTDERFSVGIYVRVEAEFYLHGLPFRLAGVSQAILDKNTIGVRFLDMSERRREQLTALIEEIAEAERCGVAI